MNSPFGSSNQGGFRQQPQQQNFSQQGGFGVQTAGTFGGFQPQQQSFGFGGGQGFGGFNPFQGGYGGFQPQQQFNPFQGDYGGGFNPMFGGIGSLGFNPMMGPQFGMPMQGFNRVEDRPTPQQSLLRPDGRGGFFDPSEQRMPMQGFNPYQQQFQQQNFPSMDMMYRGGPEMSPEMRQRREQDMRGVERMVQAPWMPTITETPGFGDWQQKQQQWADQTPEGTAYKKADEALEAFKKANPNPSSYSGYWADPALKAQYDKIYGDYQSGTQQYFNKLNEYEKTNPFSPSAQQPESPFTGPQRSAQDILSMAVGNMPKDMQYDLNKDGKITSADALAYRRKYEAQPQQPAPESPGLGRLPYSPEFGRLPYDWQGYGTTDPAVPQRAQQTIADYRRQQPMFGGIGGLGFNPMMGPQFGMPMLQGMQANSAQGRAAMGSLGGMNIRPLSAEQQQLLSQLPQQTQASPSGSSFAQLAQMFGGRMPQTSSGPQQAAPPGMKWMQGYGGYSLVPESMNTYEMG